MAKKNDSLTEKPERGRKIPGAGKGKAGKESGQRALWPEEELLRGEERFRSLFDAMLEGCQVIGFDGTYLYLNSAVERQNRRPNGELLGRKYTDIWPELEKSEFFRLIEQCLAKRLPGRLETEIVVKDGSKLWFDLSLQPVLEGVFILSIDITERKRAEKKTYESGIRYRRLFESARDGILILDGETGMIVDANPFLLELLGYTYEEFIGKAIWEIGLLKDVFAGREKFLELKGKGYVRYEDLPLETAKGRAIAVEFVSNVYLVDHVKVIQCNIRDITEQRRQEEARRLSEEKFAKTFTLSPITMAISSIREGIIIDVNESFLKITGYTKEEVVGRSSRDLNIFTDYEDRNNLVGIVKTEGHVDGADIKLRMKNGKIRDSLFSMAMITVGGEPCLLSSLLDVTERNRAEKARRLSEEKFVRTFQSTPIPMALAAIADKRISDINEAFLEKTGYTREEVIGRTAGELSLYVKNSDRDWLLETTLVQGRTSKMGVKLRMKNGEIRDFDFSVVLMNLADGPQLLTFALDVTERERAEEALRLSEEKFSKAFAGSPIAMCLSKVGDGKFVDVNEAFLESTGYSREEVIGRTGIELNIFLSQAERERIVDEVITKGEIYGMEFQARTKSGIIRDCLISMTRVSVGADSYFLSSVLDITDHKRIEEALQENEALIKGVLDHLPVGVAVNAVDPSVTFGYMNDNFPKFYRTSREKLADADGFWEAVYEDPQFRAEMKKRVLEDCETGDPDRMVWTDIPITRMGEETSFVTARNIPFSGKPLMISLVSDVTERIRTEEKIGKRLRYEETLAFISLRAAAITDLGDFQNKILEKLGETLDVSRVYIFEYRKETDTGDNTYEWTAPGVFAQKDDFKNVPAGEMPWWMENLRNNKIINIADIEDIPSEKEKEVVKRGNVKSILIVPFFVAGELYGFIGFDECRRRREWPKEDVDLLASISRIITGAIERKHAEDELRSSENRFRDLYENISLGFYQTTPDGRVLMANPAMVTMLGFESFEELASRDLADEGFAPDYPRREFLERIERDGEISGFESQWKRKDGSVIFVRENARLVRDEKGNILFYEGTAENITEKKKMEIQMTGQLDELKRWHTVTLGRETRLLDLKREVNELLAASGQAPRYPSAESED